jgi:predicted metal-dependent enzyme (double-stranded beta helix superfamily)
MELEDILIPQLRDAVALGNPEAIAERLKHELSEMIDAGEIRLPERFREVRPDAYARRLLHRDAETGFTAVVMTWGPGQRTPLHDHAGIWCVEGVVEGRMEVEQFELVDDADGRYRFESRGHVVAGPGSSGALIPPYEYHVLANASREARAVTLHVYGGEMDHCCVYEPRPDGSFERRSKQLGYAD